MGSHTPGPWTIDDGDITETIRALDGLDIAFITPRARRGDARLIAAAPDLLAALNDLLGAAERVHHFGMTRTEVMVHLSPWLGPARAAIAKATGEAGS